MALLETAERLLRDGRFGEASLEEIASDAGMSRQNFYFYFASKQALLASLVSHTLDDMRDELVALSSSMPAGPEPLSVVRAGLFAATELWWRHTDVLITAVHMAGAAPEIFEQLTAMNDALLDSCAETLVAVGRTPETRDFRAARETARMLMWMGERTAYVLARTKPDRTEYHALADRLYGLWLRAAGIPASED
jgi:TetR/AcrR family transcriptional regulator, ethionamide resistance regulator